VVPETNKDAVSTAAAVQRIKLFIVFNFTEVNFLSVQSGGNMLLIARSFPQKSNLFSTMLHNASLFTIPAGICRHYTGLWNISSASSPLTAAPAILPVEIATDKARRGDTLSPAAYTPGTVVLPNSSTCK
ncbi:hypothetical protein NLO95_28775, partial [Pseudomonas syringae]|nr:hypothetical protein [Pseudomonas syringae]